MNPNININTLLPIADLLRHMHEIYTNKAQNNQLCINIVNGHYKIHDNKNQNELANISVEQLQPIKTAAISMLAIQLLQPTKEPTHVAIYGTGKQAQAHIYALLELYPNIIIDVIGKSPNASLQFVQSYADRRVRCTRIVFPEVDLVITATNSQRSVYSLQADTNRLIIGVGAQDHEHIEIGRNTIQKSTIYTDDINSAKKYAGDLIKADVDWNGVHDIFQSGSTSQTPTPIIFKNMGASVWDQALANCIGAKTNLY